MFQDGVLRSPDPHLAVECGSTDDSYLVHGRSVYERLAKSLPIGLAETGTVAAMRIAIGADHAGYPLKQHLLSVLADQGHEVTDLGTDSTESVDYPDFAAAVARSVADGETERGIIVCGSGAGASIAANKIKGVRSAVAHDTYTAHQAVEHDDMNVLALGSRVVGEAVAEELIEAYLSAEFTGEERHVRRLNKVLDLEN